MRISDILTANDILAIKDACRRAREASIEPSAIEVADKIFIDDRTWGGWRHRLQNRKRYAPPLIREIFNGR